METWRQEPYHHGIMGMKWGVRRYQNKDGTLTAAGKEKLRDSLRSAHYSEGVDEDITLSKGTNFDRIGSKEEKDSGSTFVSYTDKDRLVYRANVEALPIYGEAQKIKLKAISDLKVAGGKTQVDILLDYYGDKPLADIYARDLTKKYLGSKKYKKEYKKELKRQKDRLARVLNDRGYVDDIFDYAFSKYVERESDITSYMTKRLREKGYDAAIDLWDARGFSEKPIYVIDRNKTLKTISKSELTQKEIDEAIEAYRRM